MVIKEYNDRLARIKDHNDIDDEPAVEMQICLIRWESSYVEELIEKGEASEEIGQRYLDRLQRIENLLKHSSSRFSIRRTWMRFLTFIKLFLRSLSRKKGVDAAELSEAEEMRQLQIAAESHVIEKLEKMVSSEKVPTEHASRLLLDYQRSVADLKSTGTSITTNFKVADSVDDIKRFAYQYELEQIQMMYEDERLSRACAKRMRENVYLMQLDLEDTM